MKTIVAFTDNRVQILCGDGSPVRITVNEILEVPFPAGCVANGEVTDPELFCSGIKKYGKKKSSRKRE